MNFIEFAGFVALLLFMVNSIRETKRRRENPEEFEDEDQEQAERLKAFLRGVSDDMQEMPPALPPRQERTVAKPIQKPVINATQKQKQSFTPQKPVATLSKPIKKGHSEHIHTPYGDAYATDEIDPYAPSKTDAYAFVQKKQNRSQALKRRLHSPKDMVLWHEIIGPPIALKNERLPGNFPH